MHCSEIHLDALVGDRTRVWWTPQPKDPWARTCKGLETQHEMVVVACCFNALPVQTLGRYTHHNKEDHDAGTDGERGVCGRRERAHRQPQGRGRKRLQRQHSAELRKPATQACCDMN